VSEDGYLKRMMLLVNLHYVDEMRGGCWMHHNQQIMTISRFQWIRHLVIPHRLHTSSITLKLD